MDFKDLLEYTRDLKAHYANRNAMDDDMEEMYLLNWGEEAEAKRAAESVKITKSTDARDKLNGAIRLLTATEPEFTVPKQTKATLAKSEADNLEHAAKVMWRAAGRVRGDPIHYDIVRSSLIFGEYFVSITDTDALVKYGKGQVPAIRHRYEDIARRVPYLFEVHDPRTCYPDKDQLGLRAMYREQVMTVREAKAQFGAAIEGSLAGLRQHDTITLCDYYDLERRIVWVDGESEPFINEVHNLEFIPYVTNTIEGGRLFADPEYQAQPFLYGPWKSGIYNRQNMMLTALFTSIYAMALNPVFIEEQGPSGGEVQIDFSVPGGKIIVPYGSKFYPMVNKGVIDPSITDALELTNRIFESSTIHGQTLGEPLGANAAFSMVALLHQAGRLPLVVAQRKAGWGIGDAIRMAFLWQRSKATRFKVRYGDNQAELDYQSIPEDFEIEAKLDVDLPQDKLQMASVATQLANSPLASVEWIQNNILGIGNSGEMAQQRWSERAAEMMFDQLLQSMMAGPQQGQGMELGGRQPGQAGPPPQGPMPEEGMPMEGDGMPPGMETGMQPQAPLPNAMRGRGNGQY